LRLAKYLAHAGVASRRASEQLIADGRVTVDGEVVTDPARGVTDEAVSVDGRPVQTRSDHVVYALNKPAGVVSTASDPQGRPKVVDLVSTTRRLYPVGRLDAETKGLILLTDDGDLAHRLTHPSFEVPRIYHARVRHLPVRQHALRALREGVELEDGLTAPARVRPLGPDLIELTIREGKKRQVRRMLEAVGHPVVELRRVAFGPLWIGDLAEGSARRLKAAEIERLRKTAAEQRPRGRSGRGSSRPNASRRAARG
jgi:23S rRNA pseudouridine2605 synthase